MGLAYDLNEIVNGEGKQTNFGTMLLKLIFKADDQNMELLRMGFPEAVELVENYRKTGDTGVLAL